MRSSNSTVLRRRRVLAEADEEEGLVDAAFEDRDAHLHALGDDLATLEASFARELGGRQVDRHRMRPLSSILSCVGLEVYTFVRIRSTWADEIPAHCGVPLPIPDSVRR